MSCISDPDLKQFLRQDVIAPYVVRGREKKLPTGLIPKNELSSRQVSSVQIKSNRNNGSDDRADEIELCRQRNNSAKQEELRLVTSAITEHFGDVTSCLESFNRSSEHAKTILSYVTSPQLIPQKIALSASREPIYYPDNDLYSYFPTKIDDSASTVYEAEGFQILSWEYVSNGPTVISHMPSQSSTFDKFSPPENHSKNVKKYNVCLGEIRELLSVLTLGTANINKGLREYHTQKCLDGTSGYYKSTSLNPTNEVNKQACIEKSATASALRKHQDIMSSQERGAYIPSIVTMENGKYDSTG